MCADDRAPLYLFLKYRAHAAATQGATNQLGALCSDISDLNVRIRIYSNRLWIDGVLRLWHEGDRLTGKAKRDLKPARWALLIRMIGAEGRER